VVQFRASFVQSDRAVIQAESIQGLDGRLSLSRVCHFNESETPGSARVTVRNDGDRFNGSVRPEKIFQLRFRGRRIQVSNEDVDHNVSAEFSVNCFPSAKSEEAISVDIASSQDSSV
jgi:hypothetical protein